MRALLPLLRVPLLVAALALVPAGAREASASPAPGPVLSLVSNLQAAPWFSWWWTLGVGARPLGMGGAFTAIADEASAVYWNPAGLGQLTRPEFTVFTGSLYLRGDIASGWPGVGLISFIWPVPRPQVVFGLSFVRNIHTYPDEWPYIPITYYGFFADPGIIGGPPIRVIFPYIQEDTMVVSVAAPFTWIRDLYVGVNAKYSVADRLFVSRYQVPGARGFKAFAADFAALYRIPLFRFGRELVIALNAQDAAGGLRYGNSQSQTLPPVVRIGTMYKTNVLRREDTILAADWAQAVDPRYPAWRNRKLHFGIEQWLLTQTVAIRAGYDQPLGYFGWWSVGASFRLAGVNLDIAYRHGRTEIAPDHLPGSTWFSLSYRFGSGPRTPLPIVRARADPSEFSPHSEETTAIQLSVDNEFPVSRWMLALNDPKDKTVKVFQDQGEPPPSVVWAGEDQRFQILADGEYRYTFKVQDTEGRISVTPPGTVKVVSGRVTAPGDPSRLFAMVESQRRGGTQVREQQKTDVKRRLDEHKAAEATPTFVPGAHWEGTGPGPWATATSTPLPQPAAAGAPQPGAFAYPAIPSGNLLDAYVATNPDKSKTLALDYVTGTNQVTELLGEVVSIARGMGAEAGPGVANVDIRAHYGDNVLRVNAPMTSTRAMRSGNTTPQSWLSTSYVTVNGQPISPRLP